ncbi:MAG: type II toxin-antitoxin system HipA family toxin [Candidatus Aminicenantes bacterium]|nr:type II toxin-antitoxin system HipA family toxin [Candidatus Aminicenantes bacterium]
MAARTKRVNVARVRLWDQDAGAVAWNEERGIGEFEYEAPFLRQGLELAPLTMPLRSGIFSFPGLNRDTFHGLPGLLADALPDRFGNRIIDVWLARQGRSPKDFTPLERLCYMGNRAMGALEFKPAIGPRARQSVPIEISELSRLAADILHHRTDWAVNLKGNRAEALNMIIRVGTSAGGNRAKAVIAWNPQTEEVRSGQVPPPPGFEPWILKFDGVDDAALGDLGGYGRAEYVYHRMAVMAGIEMTSCRLLKEGPRAHFMTRRFDRDESGKIHVQSLCAMAHFDFNAAGQYSYEQALQVIQKLALGYPALEEFFRRMVFNVLARNQDDHTRNIAFLMDRQGKWRLSPAFDMVWAYNPSGDWTSRQQMSVNGKRDGFSKKDLLAVAGQFGIRNATAIMEQAAEAVAAWPRLASAEEVPPELSEAVRKSLRLDIIKSK